MNSVAHGNFCRAYLYLPIETKCKNDISHFRDFHCEVCLFSNHLAAIPTSKVNKLNSVALVRKRTIPTERPPLSAK
jgi:hypothetical protein